VIIHEHHGREHRGSFLNGGIAIGGSEFVKEVEYFRVGEVLFQQATSAFVQVSQEFCLGNRVFQQAFQPLLWIRFIRGVVSGRFHHDMLVHLGHIPIETMNIFLF